MTETEPGEWATPCIRKAFTLSPRGSARLVDFLRGSELSPDLLAEFMMSARTRLARRAIQIESEPVDREGGFKRVWYDEDDDPHAPRKRGRWDDALTPEQAEAMKRANPQHKCCATCVYSCLR